MKNPRTSLPQTAALPGEPSPRILLAKLRQRDLRASRCLLFGFGCVSLLALTAQNAQADSPTDTWTSGNTSLFKTSDWSTSAYPTTGVTGIIAETHSNNPLGWNYNTNTGSQTFGDLDFTSGTTHSLTIGEYTTVTSSPGNAGGAINITLGGSTLNSLANTVIANSSTHTITFENEVFPSAADSLVTTGLVTFVLPDSTTASTPTTSNYIVAATGSNVTINNAITGADASSALTFYGGGSSGTSGSTLELGAGSANDVTGAVGANVPSTPGNAAYSGFSNPAGTQQTGDKNTFAGGLTIGDIAGSANAGIVKVDSATGLPTSGTITVNTNSQLLLNASGAYGGSGQSLILNGAGAASSTSGALLSPSGNTSTWLGNVSLGSASTINAQSGGSLAISGSISGSAQLTKVGAGELDLNASSASFSGGFSISNGSLIAGNGNALGDGPVLVAGGTLGLPSVTTAAIGAGGSLSINSGVIDLAAQSAATFSLASGVGFTMSGGTLGLTYSSGNTGSISSAGGGSSFSITSGTLDLGGAGGWNYATTYTILSGFGSGSVSGLTITDYDATDYTASLSSAGVLSFTAVPEPSTWATLFGGLAMLVSRHGFRRRFRR